ncbi:MAG: hypothetical protein RLZZ488_104 [Pseudomonadota bacterium]|jgi:hypothetical protein
MDKNSLNSQSVKFTYSPPTELVPSLWILDGTWSNFLGRRMTVIRLRNNEVWIHNPMRLHKPELDWLSSLGFIRGLVAPNQWHVSDLLWMAEQFPEAQIVCPQSFLDRHPSLSSRMLFTTDVQHVTPDHELEFLPVPGVRFEETVLFHPLSRTLILCDLMMNLPPAETALRRAFFKLNNMGECCSPTRTLKWLLTNDKKELLHFVSQLAELNPRRIVVNHGEIFEGEGGNQIRTSFALLFG